jgi:putative addiction module component (TIGR02574 family)
MAHPLFDFSHLSPAERIELAERLWDSLEPWQQALDEIEKHGR